MITIIKDKYEADGDQWGWKLHSYRKPSGPKAKKEVSKITSYYGTWEQLIKKVLDLEVGTVDGDLQAVIEKLEQVKNEIVERTKP